VGGTCGGTLAGNTYTTAAISGPCTVAASFTLIPPVTFTVTAVGGGQRQHHAVDAANHRNRRDDHLHRHAGGGLHATVAGTCGGALVGNTYTTAAITAACTVSATFTLIPPTTFLLTVSSSGAGSVTSSRPASLSGATAPSLRQRHERDADHRRQCRIRLSRLGWRVQRQRCLQRDHECRPVGDASFGAAPTAGLRLTLVEQPGDLPFIHRIDCIVTGTTPTGTVTFTLPTDAGAIMLCPAVPLVSARATCPVPGYFNINKSKIYAATYSGDANNPDSNAALELFVDTDGVALDVITAPLPAGGRRQRRAEGHRVRRQSFQQGRVHENGTCCRVAAPVGVGATARLRQYRRGVARSAASQWGASLCRYLSPCHRCGLRAGRCAGHAAGRRCGRLHGYVVGRSGGRTAGARPLPSTASSSSLCSMRTTSAQAGLVRAAERQLECVQHGIHRRAVSAGVVAVPAAIAPATSIGRAGPAAATLAYTRSGTPQLHYTITA